MHDLIIASERKALLDERETLIHKLVLPGGRVLTVYTPHAALANRRAVYGLATDEEAVAAIMREHASRELALGDDSNAGSPRLAALGGLRQDVTVRRGSEADLPPAVPPAPTPKQVLADMASKATTLDELRAAIIAFCER